MSNTSYTWENVIVGTKMKDKLLAAILYWGCFKFDTQMKKEKPMHPTSGLTPAPCYCVQHDVKQGAVCVSIFPNPLMFITSHSLLTFLPLFGTHNVKLVKRGFVGSVRCTSNQANCALHNQTQAKARADYLGPPWYCTAQYILTWGFPLGLDVELGIINGVDV